MKNNIICIVSLLLLASVFAVLGLSGCDSMNEPISKETEKYERFIVVDENIDMDSSGVYFYKTIIYADKETGVQYLVAESSHRAGITVLLDSDGKPLIYDFEKDSE